MQQVLANSGPVEDHFACIPRTHGREARLKLVPRKMMCDDRRDIHAWFQHDRHLVPGFVHLAAVDALDGEHVEDDLAPVHRHLLGGNSENGDFAAVAHVGDHVVQRLRIAGHLQTQRRSPLSCRAAFAHRRAASRLD